MNIKNGLLSVLKKIGFQLNYFWPPRFDCETEECRNPADSIQKGINVLKQLESWCTLYIRTKGRQRYSIIESTRAIVKFDKSMYTVKIWSPYGISLRTWLYQNIKIPESWKSIQIKKRKAIFTVASDKDLEMSSLLGVICEKLYNWPEKCQIVVELEYGGG